MDLSAMEVGQELVDPVAELEAEWLEKRRGKLTCSKFAAIMGEGRSNQEFTKAGYTYLYQKVAERLGSYVINASAPATRWGHEHEPAAIAEYQDRTGREVAYQPHEFISLNEWVGGSPDGLVGDDGVLEAKCPHNPAMHIATLVTREVPSEYVWQVQGHLFVTRRAWCDFISFDPRIDGSACLAILRVDRDEKRIDALRDRTEAATRWIQGVLERAA